MRFPVPSGVQKLPDTSTDGRGLSVTCDEVRELGGAYALHAVSVEERRAIEEHIESCRLHGSSRI